MGAASRKPKFVLVDNIRHLMLERLALSGLTEEDAVVLGVIPVTAEEALAAKLPAAGIGFKLPYFNLDATHTDFYRVRYLEDTRDSWGKLAGKKPLRYAQPPGSVNGVYMPPFIDWEAVAADPEVPLLITEGELKAAAATKLGLPTMGLGGVWGFQSTRKTQALLLPLQNMVWKGRPAYIIYDSDAATNPDILRAEARLAERLCEEGASVFVCRIPPSADGGKVGLDDWLVANNGDLDLFRATIMDVSYEYAASAALHELNNKCTYVWDPGLVWNHEKQQRHMPGAFKEHAFANIHFFEKRIGAKGIESLTKVPAAKAWLEWPHRAECKGLMFAPGQPRTTDANYLNTWRGWGLPEPAKGNVEPWHVLMRHLFGVDVASRKWLEQWLAYPLRHPGAKLATGALVWGQVHGSGKTLVGHTMMRIYGANAAEIHDDNLDDPRNAWAVEKQFILADDIVAKGDRKLMRRLMTLITQKTMWLDIKYIPSYSIPDCCNYYYTSNSPDAFYLDDGDRRFWIHEVMADKFLPHKEYADWYKSDEGAAALWWYLLHVDLAGFDPQAPAPETRGKREMLELGKSELGGWVQALKEDTAAVLSKFNLQGDLFTAAELHMVFDPAGVKRTTVNALAREMKHAGFRAPANGTKLRGPDGRALSVYCVRNWSYWATAKWKDACAHYASHHMDLTPKRVKY